MRRIKPFHKMFLLHTSVYQKTFIKSSADFSNTEYRDGRNIWPGTNHIRIVAIVDQFNQKFEIHFLTSTKIFQFFYNWKTSEILNEYNVPKNKCLV